MTSVKRLERHEHARRPTLVFYNHKEYHIFSTLECTEWGINRETTAGADPAFS